MPTISSKIAINGVETGRHPIAAKSGRFRVIEKFIGWIAWRMNQTINDKIKMHILNKYNACLHSSTLR